MKLGSSWKTYAGATPNMVNNTQTQGVAHMPNRNSLLNQHAHPQTFYQSVPVPFPVALPQSPALIPSSPNMVGSPLVNGTLSSDAEKVGKVLLSRLELLTAASQRQGSLSSSPRSNVSLLSSPMYHSPTLQPVMAPLNQSILLTSSPHTRGALLGGALFQTLQSHEESKRTNSSPGTKRKRVYTKDNMNKRKKGQRWTKEEDDLLRIAVNKFNGRRWKEVARYVEGRDHVQCRQRWQKALVPGLKKGHWSVEEDELLVSRLNMKTMSGDFDWKAIAQGLSGRSVKQCRERWTLHLDPNIKKGNWKKYEDEIILRKQKEVGNQWAVIARSLKRRTANNVKIRFFSLTRNNKKQQMLRRSTSNMDQRRRELGIRKDKHGDTIIEIRQIHSSAVYVSNVQRSECMKILTVQFSDGEISEYCSEWLLDNCPSHRQAGTGQKQSNIEDYAPENVLAREAQIISNGSALRIDWAIDSHSNSVGAASSLATAETEYPDQTPQSVRFRESTQSSQFEAAWLRAFSFSPNEAARLYEERFSRECNEKPSASNSNALIPRISYEQVVSDPKGLWEWTSRVVRDGLCIIEGVPIDLKYNAENDPNRDGFGNSKTIDERFHPLTFSKPETWVEAMACRLGPVMETLYGRGFDVRQESNAINIAYTSAHLKLHMDLPYYESPPGIQMLHCVSFDPAVIGGESTFLDTFAVAEEFRRRSPQLFEVLCRIPATFMKDHLDRESPAQMYYRRPHIVVEDGDVEGAITSVFWSPPFEGPLRASSSSDVSAYYKAYRAFAEFIDSEEVKERWWLETRLDEGDLVSFNQRRMLHGRNAFTLSDNIELSTNRAGRHLQGCYVNIDDFLSRHRALELQYGMLASSAGRNNNFLRGQDFLPRCGNQTL
eukprot:g3735.t1